MAVKIYCSICERYIKNAGDDEISKLTGKEICSTCSKKMSDLKSYIDSKIEGYEKDLMKMLSDAKKKFGELDKVHNKFFSEARSLQTTLKAEINSRMGSEVVE